MGDSLGARFDQFCGSKRFAMSYDLTIFFPRLVIAELAWLEGLRFSRLLGYLATQA